VWLLVCTTYAGWIKIFDANPALGFLAQARKYQAAIADGQMLGTAKSVGQMQQVMVNSYINATLTALFLLVVLSVLAYSIKTILVARRNPQRTDRETPFVALSDEQVKAWL
ncbi:MAG: carbon starvation protein A, partial [Xanthomonadaceae bacterium]|nr:carbon starvation protein A [Xanthomonadaceae bacterium]